MTANVGRSRPPLGPRGRAYLSGTSPTRRCQAERVRVGELSNDEGNRLLLILRRGKGSVVAWRRAQMVAVCQGMNVGHIAEVAFTSAERVREVIHKTSTTTASTPSTRYLGVAHPIHPA